MKTLPNFKEINKSNNGKINRLSTQRESLDLKLNRIQRLDLISHRRVDLISELDSYHYYLKFSIKVRYNDLIYRKKYIKEQCKTLNLIQSLRSENYFQKKAENLIDLLAKKKISDKKLEKILIN